MVILVSILIKAESLYRSVTDSIFKTDNKTRQVSMINEEFCKYMEIRSTEIIDKTVGKKTENKYKSPHCEQTHESSRGAEDQKKHHLLKSI